jgi:hypothetical protein
MTNTWLNVGSDGAGVGVGAGVAVGVAVGAGVGDEVGEGVGVATGLGVGVGVGFVLGFGVALLMGGGVGVPCAELVGFAVAVLGLPDPDGVEAWDGARAIGGCVMDPGALGGPSINDVIHNSKAPKAVQMMSRRSNHMCGTPPTHH